MSPVMLELGGVNPIPTRREADSALPLLLAPPKFSPSGITDNRYSFFNLLLGKVRSELD